MTRTEPTGSMHSERSRPNHVQSNRFVWVALAARHTVPFTLGTLLAMSILLVGGGFVGTAAADAPDCSEIEYETSDDGPLEVSTVDQLQCINENHADADDRADALGSDYILVEDINASETAEWNGGDGFDPIGEFTNGFTGTFDGAGHTISNLYIDRGVDVGLFGEVVGGTVEDVGVEDVDITGSERVGGLVGDNNGGDVTQSYANGDVEGSQNVGGLVGYNRGDGEVTESYSTGDVEGDGSVGGLVGQNSDDVTESYATGDVNGSSNVGGLVGVNSGTDSEVTDGYWDEETTDQNSSAGSDDENGLSTDEMQRLAPYANMDGFSFGSSETWLTVDDYPALAWEDVTELTLDDPDVDVPTATAGESDEVTVTAEASDGDPAEEVDIDVTDADGIDDLDGTSETTDENGEATFSFTEATADDYDVDVEWAENSSVNATSSVTVEAAAPDSVDVDDVTETAGESGELNATVEDEFGNLVPDEDVDVADDDGLDLDGETETTDDDGNATFAFTDSTLGAYDVDIALADDSDVTDTATVTLDAGDPSRLDGDGSEGDPYEITDVVELQSMGNDLDAHYELVEDIDAEDTDGWYDGDGFDPVGEYHNNDPVPFTGTFDGDGHVIDGLTIERGDEDGVGLFGQSQGTIRDLTLTNASVGGNSYVGSVVGRSFSDGKLTNVTVDVEVTGAGQNVGGLAGYTREEVSNLAASGPVTNTGSRTGGLVGWTYGGVSGSMASVNVNGSERVGGLVGENWDDVEESYATGDVDGSDSVGGLVGYNRADVTESYAAGDVNGSENVGGFIGYNPSGDVTKSYATGDVNGSDDVGGLVGENSGAVTESYAIGDVNGSDYVGGLVGVNSGTDGDVTDGYWDENTTDQNSSAGSPDENGLSTEEMQRFAPLVNMGGLSFDSPGTWNVTDGYPALAWEDREELTIKSLDADADESTITVTVMASDGKNAGEYVTVEVTDDDGLTDLDGANGTTDENGEVTFTFDEEDVGEYQPEFAWEGDESVTDTAMVAVEDTTPPVVDAGENRTIEEDEELTLNASNATDNVGIDTYQWEFGDGNTSTGVTANHTYPTPGTYTVNLTANDSAGNVGMDSLVVTVLDITPPTVDAGGNQTIDEGDEISFNGSNSTDNVGIDSYEWEFGDGNTSIGETTDHTYDDPGIYTANLTVTDAADNAVTDSVVVTVNDTTPPVAAAGDNQTVTEGQSVSFNGTNSTDNVGIDDYAWEFGDGANDTGATPTHTYSQPGTYTANLTVTDGADHNDTDSLTVTVEAEPSGGGAPPIIGEDDDEQPGVDLENGEVTIDVGGEVVTLGIGFGDGDASGSVTVEFLDGLPEDVDPLPGDVSGLAFVDVTVPSDLTDSAATLQLTLDVDSLGDHDPADLVVYHHDDGEWTALETTVETSNGEVVIEAETPGFSLFAVGPSAQQTTPDDGTETPGEAASDETTPDAVGTATSTPPAETTPEPDDDAFEPFDVVPFVVFLVGAAALVALALVLTRRRR